MNISVVSFRVSIQINFPYSPNFSFSFLNLLLSFLNYLMLCFVRFILTADNIIYLDNVYKKED